MTPPARIVATTGFKGFHASNQTVGCRFPTQRIITLRLADILGSRGIVSLLINLPVLILLGDADE